MVEPGGKWKRLGTLISLRSEISKSSITVSCSSSVPFIPSFTFTDDCGQPLLLTLEEVVLLILLMWSWLLWLVRRWNHRRIPSTSVPLPPIQNVFLISLFVYSHQHSSLSPSLFLLSLSACHLFYYYYWISLSPLSLSLSRVAYMVCLGFFNSHLWSVWIGRSVRRRGKRDMRRFTLPHVGFATSVLTLWVMTEHKYLLHVFVSLIIIIIISMSLVFYYSINIYLKEPAFFSVSLIN